MTTPELAPVAALAPKTKLSGKIIKTTLAGAINAGDKLAEIYHRH